MYPINDRQYLKICAEIAKRMSISLSSAKKKVEIQIAKEGSKTIQEKIQVAQNVLKICEKNSCHWRWHHRHLFCIFSTKIWF